MIKETKELIAMSNVAMDRYRKFQQDGVPDKVTWPNGAPEGMVSADEAVEEMLAVFCKFLNQFDEEYVMAPDQFYHREILAAYETPNYWAVAVDVYDGDDGGSSVLTGYFNVPMETIDGLQSPPSLWYLTQEFDTMITMVLDEGKLRNPDGEYVKADSNG